MATSCDLMASLFIVLSGICRAAPSPTPISPIGREKGDGFDVAAPEPNDDGKPPLPSPRGIRKAAVYEDQKTSVQAEVAAIADDDAAASTTKWATPAPADSRAAPSQQERPEDGLLHTGDVVAGSDSDWDSDEE